MNKSTPSQQIDTTELTAVQTAQSRSLEDIQPSTSVRSMGRWNHPRSNLFRLASTYFCFFLLGCNDSSYGFLIPHFETYYHVQYATVSLIFLSAVAGFIVSTLCNYSVHFWVGPRGVALIAGVCHLIAFAVACAHPPFPVLVVAYTLVGLGGGAKTAAWNVYVSSLEDPNELLGLLHGFYGMGATLTPSLASFLVTQRGWPWYSIYYWLLILAFCDFVVSCTAFRQFSGQAYRDMNLLRSDSLAATSTQPSHGRLSDNRNRLRRALDHFLHSPTIQCLKHKIVLLCSAYLLSYVGSEVALGGWLVTFMNKVRHGSLFASGIVSSGFWAGITFGRIILGFVTGRWFKSENRACMIYLILAIVLELLFWLIPKFLSSAITAGLLGFFLGPLFPGVIACLSKSLPKSTRLTSIGIVSAVGASGASVVPFLVGAIAQAKGVQVLQPIILACLCLCLGIWILLPGLKG